MIDFNPDAIEQFWRTYAEQRLAQASRIMAMMQSNIDALKARNQALEAAIEDDQRDFRKAFYTRQEQSRLKNLEDENKELRTKLRRFAHLTATYDAAEFVDADAQNIVPNNAPKTLDVLDPEILPVHPADLDRQLTPREAADYLNISLCTLAIWRQKGKGPPFHKLGPRTIRYHGREIAHYLLKGTAK